MTITTTAAPTPQTTSHIRRAVMRAMLAPSTHNTQPWLFVAGPTYLDVFADPRRGLAVIDPDFRQLTISCGAAILAARLSLAADGVPVTVELLPDAKHPDHLARIEVLPGLAEPDAAATVLDRAADGRHTNRRAFTSSEPVPHDVVSRLQEAAGQEGAFLQLLNSEPTRALVIGWTAEAEGRLFADPAYRTELREWAGRSGTHEDGIPPESIPAEGAVTDQLPTRGFDQMGTGRLPAAAGLGADACLLLLSTENDDRTAWLRAGQALGRLLAQLTSEGLVAGLYTQLTEVHRIREQVRSLSGVAGYPQLLLRVGYAETTAPTPRRPVPEVLTVTGRQA